MPAALFTVSLQGAKGLIFIAAAPESQPALAADEGPLLIPRFPGDSLWSLLTRHGVPVAPLLVFMLPGVGCSVLAHDLCVAVSIIPGAALSALQIFYCSGLCSALPSDVGPN